jgi:hypothetical protein
MGGFGIPNTNESIIGFQQNLIKKIHMGITQPHSNLPSIFLGLLERANRLSLAKHIQHWDHWKAMRC